MRRRSLQIAANIQRELQNRLARGLADPRIKGLITVTKVELSDDLKNAKAFITVLPPEHAKITMHGLKSATGKLRKDVMDRIHIKEMPTLQLVYDEGLKAQMEVMALLEKDRQERSELDAKRSPDGAQAAVDGVEGDELEGDGAEGEQG
ncbi:MAG: 30S ribosome-binding factor RbfA [Phycisphaerales bacterium]